jgi:hypothetical protein
MRGYQLEGYEWMTSLWENGINGILGTVRLGLGQSPWYSIPQAFISLSSVLFFPDVSLQGSLNHTRVTVIASSTASGT